MGFLLDTVDHGTYVHTHEDLWDLDGHDHSQHNPGARDLAARHGFVPEVRRQWTDEDGNVMVHTITELSSPANAESLDLQVARYSCRFAEDVWPVPFVGRAHPLDDGADILSEASSSPADDRG